MAQEIVGKPIATAFLKYAEKMEKKSAPVVGQRKSSPAPSADQFKNKPASQTFIKMLEKTGQIRQNVENEEVRTELMEQSTVPGQRTSTMSAEELLREALKTSPKQAVDLLIKRLGGK